MNSFCNWLNCLLLNELLQLSSGNFSILEVTISFIMGILAIATIVVASKVLCCQSRTSEGEVIYGTAGKKYVLSVGKCLRCKFIVCVC